MPVKEKGEIVCKTQKQDAFTESKYGTGKDADAYVDAQIDNFSVKAFVVPADGENDDAPSTVKKVTPPKTSIR